MFFKSLATVLATFVAFQAEASVQACNHDADPQDVHRLSKDVAKGNVQDFVSVKAGTVITMGYGQQGRRITCITTQDRTRVRTKTGEEYDAACGNTFYNQEKKSEPLASTQPVKPADDQCDWVCEAKKSCKGNSSLSGDTFVCDLGESKYITKRTIITQEVFEHKQLPPVGTEIQTQKSRINITGQAAEVNISSPRPIPATRNNKEVCEHLHSMLILRNGKPQIEQRPDRTGNNVRQVAVLSPSKGSVWTPLDAFNRKLKECGCREL